MYLCTQNYDLKRGGTFETAMAGTFHSVTAGTSIPLFTSKGQILVNIEDMSMLKDIKKAISLLKGVGRITVPRTKRLSSYERSLRDLDEGRVYEYDSLDDLIKEIEG
jgi:hypothetical protein